MLDLNIQYLKGVGPKRASRLNKLGIFSVRDIIGYFPREYEDRRKPLPIASLVSGQRATIKGKVQDWSEQKLSMRLSVFEVKVKDITGTAYGTFFRKANPYQKFDVFSSLKKNFLKGAEVYLSGICESRFGQKQISVDDYEALDLNKKDSSPLIHFDRIVPVYALTEGINQKWLRELLFNNVFQFSKQWPETLIGKSHKRYAITASEAIEQIHFPAEFKIAEYARQRLAFEEFLTLETALSLVRAGDKKIAKERPYELKRNLLTPFRNKLSFEFTAPQKKVINEIFRDMNSAQPMNRLLMGDVGSGKTVVALSAILYALENGYQAVLAAPTEILAEQHFITISKFLEGLPVRAVLLTGRISAKKSDKERLLTEVSAGKADLVIGTHAVLEKNVAFKNLALIVVDEQHRFGVAQRAGLQSKSTHPDVLVMTATPIPRTLALTVYGDMDVSTITDLPPGRLPIETRHQTPDQAYQTVRQEIKKGNKAFIVYPLVEESDKIELKAAVGESETLSKTVFKGLNVGLLHGQMKSAQREQTMLDFRSGKFDILIATTVIEVGIDVPDATVMVIEHADRFGLATLHQLRGRIGRSHKKSYCILVGEPKTEQSKERIKVMLETSNGFRIAEKDLRLRGPGEFFGTAQSGMLALRAGNVVNDIRLIEDSRVLAKEIIEIDPELKKNENRALRSEIERAFGKTLNLFKIG